MTEANAINSSSAGIVGNTGTAFVSTAVTQYNVLSGVLTKDFYGKMINPEADEKVLIRWGRINTALIGGITIVFALGINFVRGFTPNSSAFSDDTTTTAAAPSFLLEEFPAVHTPPNTGFSFESFSNVVSGLGPSSLATIIGPPLRWGTEIRMISSANFPALIAAQTF